MDRVNSDDRARQIVRGLFLFNGLIWIAFGINSLVRLAENPSTQDAMFQAIALMMFGNAAAMLVSAWLIGKRDVWGFWFALAILLVNVLFTFTDQVGFYDWATLAIDIVILVILLVKRKTFLASAQQG